MRKVFHFHGTIFKLVFMISLGLTCILPYGYGGSFSQHKVLEVERKLKQLRKYSLKAIQSEDGDIIDCIDIHKQPAFDHPALKHHKIQMAPTYNATKEEGTKSRKTRMAISQVWQKSGRCPEGTIPIRRIRKRDILKAHSIQDYGRKKPYFSPPLVERNHQNLDSSVQQRNHSKAILFTLGFRYLAAKGDIRVFTPFVEQDDEYSTSQVALINGAYNDYECIEAGWAVNPSVYGDRQTRLFVYWTVDGSMKTGCFDMTCPGFIQTSSEIALGAAIHHPPSIPADLPYAMTIYIYKDPGAAKWWLQYNEEKIIGYWPGEIFSAMSVHAESVEWGGEVYSTRVGTSPHTRTNMGSGRFSDPVFQSSGTVTRMRIQDNYPALKFPRWIQPFSDEFKCYDTYFIADYVEDPEFYYGGPGRNPICP